MFPALNTSMLSSAKAQIARLIEQEFAAAGFSPYVAAAAVVNAYAESGLNPVVVGDKGASVGLFQLHERGAGAGMSVAQRQDPTLNTRRIIETAKKSRSFMAVAGSTSVADLAAAFSTHVERPADTKKAEATRRALSAKLYPYSSTAPAPAPLSLPTLEPVVPTSLANAGRSTDWWLPAAGIALASLLVAVIVKRRRSAPQEVIEE